MIGFRWADGWEQYGPVRTNASSVWTLGTSGMDIVSVADGGYVRTGDLSLQMRSAAGSGRRSLGGDFDNIGFALGFRMERLPARDDGSTVIMQFRNSSARAHVNIRVGPTGRIQIWGRGWDRLSSEKTDILATSTLELRTATFYFIDTVVVLDNSSGSVAVHVNGEEWVTFAGDTVRATVGNAFCAEVAFGNFDSSTANSWGAGGDLYIDDIIARALAPADSGSVDFLPLAGVYWLRPDADGSLQQWERSTGLSSWALVDEIPPDGDVSYLYETTTGQQTTVEVEPLPANVNSVLGVVAVTYAKKDDSGTARMDVGLRISSTNYLLGDFALTEEYAYYERKFVLNPNTSAAWDSLTLPDILIERTG